MRQLFEADVEAFRDHWGPHDESEASFRRWLSEPTFDPSLYVVAWDGDEIAGAVRQLHLPRGERAPGLPSRLARFRLHATLVAAPRGRPRAHRPIIRRC